MSHQREKRVVPKRDASQQPSGQVELEDAALLAQFAASMHGQQDAQMPDAYLHPLLLSQPQNPTYSPYIPQGNPPPFTTLHTPWVMRPHDQRGPPSMYLQPVLPPTTPALSMPAAGPSSPSTMNPRSRGQSKEADGDEDDGFAEEKRRRNTEASARFRAKKKLHRQNLEQTVAGLSERADELERQAADLRRENGWLKEIVLLKGGQVEFSPEMISRSASELTSSSSKGNASDNEEDDHSSDGDYQEKKKGKGKYSKGKK